MTPSPDRFPALLRRLDALSLRAVARLVGTAAPDPADDDALLRKLGVAPRHAWLFRSWLAALRTDPERERELEREAGEADPADQAELDHCYAQLGFPPEMARYHRAALARLPELLRDEVTAQELLFDGTDALAALGAYQRNVFTAHLNETCGALVRMAAATTVVGRTDGAPRVVELGGGAATTTEAVLAALGDTPVEYVFTDVSRLFTTAARERFGERGGFRTALLDLDADFADQGFPVGSADLVLAGNVLHNARDVPRALARIRELLAPDGELVFTEATRAAPAVLTSMLFLLSPDPGSPPPRDGAVFLDAEAWGRELRAAGFEVRAVLPAPASPWAASGQRLWHAVAAGRTPVRPDASGLDRVLAGLGEGQGPVCEVDGVACSAADLRAAAPGTGRSDTVGRFARGLESALELAQGSAENAENSAGDSATPLPAYVPGPGPGPGLDPVVGPVAVVAGDRAGAVAALRAWERGEFVVCAAAGTAPARLLAWLERTRAAEAVLPAALARALPREPSAALTDLSALRRVVSSGATGETAAAWAALGAEAVAPRAAGINAGTTAAITAPLTDEELAARAARAADAASAGVDLDAAREALREVARASLLSLLNALRRAGCFVRPGDRHSTAEILRATRAAPAHRRLVRRWLDVLRDEGLLRPDNGSDADADGVRLRCVPDPEEYADLDQVWGRPTRHWRAALGGTGTVDYARRSAEALPELLTGERQPFTLLFPEGSAEPARALYRESVTARYQHHAVAAFVAALAETGPPRVLEIGGGTGTTTEVLLPALDAALDGRGAEADYLFTDVSPFFLDHARARFGSALRYGLLDIDGDPVEQGHPPGGFDVIVGGGVLNAAADTDASVRGLARLLAPGGWLVLTEPTAEEHWVLASQAFMMPAPRDARAATGASFLSLAQWRDVLDRAGLRRAVELPGPGHPLEPLGHRVFAAARADDRHARTD